MVYFLRKEVHREASWKTREKERSTLRIGTVALREHVPKADQRL
jgi:hypothetical protein